MPIQLPRLLKTLLRMLPPQETITKMLNYSKKSLIKLRVAFHAINARRLPIAPLVYTLVRPQEEGKYISSCILKMKSYIDNLERLRYPVTLGLGVSLILISLRKEFDGFVQNYNMHSMGKTINKLHAMLKLHEQTLPKNNAPDLHAIRAGYWKRNCPRYIAELLKNKKLSQGASGSGIFTIELYTFPNKSWVYDTGCGTHICNNTQGLRGSRKLKPCALSLYVGNGQRAAVKAIGSYYLSLPSGLENSLITQEASGSLEDLEIIQEEDTHPSIDTSLNHKEDDLEIDEPQSDIIPIRRSTRTRHAPERICLYIDAEEHELGDLGELDNYKAGLLDHNKWLFKKKTEMDGAVHTYKARLVAKGYTQTPRIDYEETFSPVADIRAIRILIAIAVFYDYEIWQMNVKTAFYMEQPKGFVNPKYPNRICKLKRSIYELKQASRQWNKRFDDEIKKFGFTQNRNEPCVYLKASGSNIPMLQDVQSCRRRCFAIKDLGEASYILGIKIYRDRSRRLIGLCQSDYIENILKRYHMENSKRGSIPMQDKLRLSKSQGASTPTKLKRMQNIPYASAVDDLYWTTVKSILKYLMNTKDMFLVYGGDIKRELRVSCYTNAEYLTDADDLKSQTGYVFVLNGGAEAVWVRKFIYGLGVVSTIKEPISMYCDNTGAITIANESGITKGARDFCAKVHYLREVIEYGDVKLEKVHTDDNLADPFTKALAFPKHSEHTKNIEMLLASSLMLKRFDLVLNSGVFGIQRLYWVIREEEGQSVSSYVLKMKGYIDNLEHLGHPVTFGLGVSLILIGLRKEFDGFVPNYNMHNLGKTISELHAMLKLHEQTLPKTNASALHVIRANKFQKVNKHKKSQPKMAARGQNHRKEKNKLAYAPKPNILPPPKREDPANDLICHEYDGFINRFVNNTIQVFRNNMVYFSAIPRDGIFEIDLSNSYTNKSSIYAVSDKRAKLDLDSALLWHCRVGHISKKRIEKLQHDGLLNSTYLRAFEKYVSCMSRKMARKPYTHQVKRSKDLLGLIYTDACGPFKIMSRQVASYFVTFTDDFSRYGYVYLLKHKHEVFETFKVFQKEVENQLSKTIKSLRSNREGEYMSQEFLDHLKDQGIIAHRTPHYTLQHNGVSDRRNRTLLDMVRSMMSQTTLPKSFWDYALETAVRILNMVPTKKVEKTPYEVWHGKAPKLPYLKVEGCEALVKRDTLTKPDKLEPRSIKCIFIGYLKETMGYSFYYPPENKVLVARYAEFLENSLITQEASGSLEDLKIIQEEDTHPSIDTSLYHEKDDQKIDEPQSDINPIHRSTRTRHALDRMCLYIDAEEHELGDLGEPANFKAALLDPEFEKWLNAMNVKMQSMKDNEVCVLAELPPNGKTIGSKWIFKKKTDMDRVVHTYKARLVEKGYTQSPGIDYEETFSSDADIRAIRILKAIAAYYDYEIWQMDVKTAFLNGYLNEEVYMEQPEFFVNPKYPNRRYCMENSKRGSIPMQEKLKLSKSQGASTPVELKRMQNVSYASSVGSIRYAVRCTRPDVAFAQNVTCRFQQNPGDLHWTSVMNILKVSCYTDVGYLTDADDLKSQTGYVFVLNGGDVDWNSVKQSIFATSYAEAEYIAAFNASKEAVWVRIFIYGLGIVPTIEEPISMYCDNTGAIAISNESGITKGTRHFRAKVHYLREVIEYDDVKLEKVHTYDNLADPFTKALALNILNILGILECFQLVVSCKSVFISYLDNWDWAAAPWTLPGAAAPWTLLPGALPTDPRHSGLRPE
nr:hypothetical protein [Tanacetum cinerariifolium]